jgi:DNA-directed RNA polymerase subunit RPC12/RpoP
MTAYRWARCGNSVASTMSDVILSLSIANRCANCTACGQ